MTITEIVDTQNTIIKMQSDVIKDLFYLLSEHVSTAELDTIKAVVKINQIADLKAGIDRD